MTSVHHFIHVNISYKHISTFTYNMSFYVQEMTHKQSSHVMVICTYKLITCQYIRTHILTFKHVTLSQAMTLLNKSYNGLKANHKQSQTKPRDRSQTCHKHRLQIVTCSPMRSLPLPRRSGLPRRAIASPRRTRRSHFLFSGLPRRTCPRPGGPLHLGEEPIFH